MAKEETFKHFLKEKEVEKLVRKVESIPPSKWKFAEKGQWITYYSVKLGNTKVKICREEHHSRQMDAAGGGYDDITNKYYSLDTYEMGTPMSTSDWSSYHYEVEELYKKIEEEKEKIAEKKEHNKKNKDKGLVKKHLENLLNKK